MHASVDDLHKSSPGRQRTTQPLGLSVTSLGIDHRHDRHFRIDRLHGSGDYLFLLFHTRIRIHSLAGVANAPANSCIVYAPPFPQWYCGVDTEFRHDWMHVSGPTVARLLEDFGIPVNQVFSPTRTTFVSGLLTDLARELTRREAWWETAVEQLLQRLFLQLGRYQHSYGVDRSPHRQQQFESFSELRLKLQQQPEKPWSVVGMATRLHLSPSRFAAIYRTFFGTTPIEDLLEARMARARWLLSFSNASIGETARQAGFQSPAYFSRLFRRRVGMTAREYRAHDGGNAQH